MEIYSSLPIGSFTNKLEENMIIFLVTSAEDTKLWEKWCGEITGTYVLI